VPIAWIAIVVGVLFVLAYRIYGRQVAARFALDDSRITPAEKHNDGFDFVPTRKSMLLAQHFASIAAAGPVVGPIVAALAFGWGPTLLWILLGCTFIGACHDFCALVASVRHDARSITELARLYLGDWGYRLSLLFIWMCLVYVVIAFTDVTAQQFLAREEWGGSIHDIGGGVATSSFLYLGLSVLMGIATTRWKIPLGIATAIFFPLLIAIVVVGQEIPIVFPVANPALAWSLVILAYCAIASMLPMWLLLQPRGYLGGYFLYLVLAVGLLGLIFGGFRVEYPAFTGFFSPRGDSLYPFLFITVACGACSGFHGLVCSGTTSKQLGKESHARLVGYGGMLLEGVVAVMALSTVMLWAPGSPVLSKSPSEIYATGIAHFAHAVLGLDLRWGLTFGMLAFATFVYDTLDVATRLGRYLVDELLARKGSARGHWMGTLGTLTIPLLYVVFAPNLEMGGKQVPLWSVIWPLFGSSNQLLAALTLLLTSVWVHQLGARKAWVLVPALFMLVTSTLALTLQIVGAARQLSVAFSLPALLNALIAAALLTLSGLFGVTCWRRLRVSPVPA